MGGKEVEVVGGWMGSKGQVRAGSGADSQFRKNAKTRRRRLPWPGFMRRTGPHSIESGWTWALSIPYISRFTHTPLLDHLRLAIHFASWS